MQAILKWNKLIIAGVLLTLAASAQAQALFLARKAIGRVEQMTQSAPANNGAGASYDVATVIVDVSADKVFAAVKRQLAQNTKLRVTRSDDAARSVDFSDGTRIGGIQVSALGDDLAQLLISTAHAGGGGTPTTSSIVAHILDVCRQVNVVCERSSM